MEKNIDVLFIGDIVGDCGIKAVEEKLPSLIEKYQPDFIIANGENAAAGKGLTEEEANRLFALGIDILTSGNHVWDNWKSRPLLSANQKVIRPLNYPPGNAGRGYTFFSLENQTEVAVLNIQGRTYMQAIDCPFRSADNALKSIQERTKIIIVDFHADASAEKVAMGWHLDGKVSAIIGTHTHIQTADACILPQGSAYITDVGMTGPYDSVVGLKKEIALKRFIFQTPFKYELAVDDVRLCGVNIKINPNNGKAISIESFMLPEPKKISES
ncbi:MAG: TIGR00282 family metallophosphoesterase [Candidatus Kapabacteria bacterium]|nr:TIGR00282 family metallophosphoesterase [Candidatus Kapabacteria bacterium]